MWHGDDNDGSGASYRILTLSSGQIQYNAGNWNTGKTFNGSTIADTTNWHYIVATYDGTTLRGYFEGAADGSSSTGVYTAGDKVTRIGNGQASGANTYYASAVLEEVRIASVSRTGEWVLTEYRNQNAPSAFYGVGPQENVGGGGSGTVPVTVTSAPVGLSLAVDGVGCTAPCVYQWTPGTSHTVAVTAATQSGSGAQYQFANWSDGGAQSHTVTVAGVSATYTASFSTQYYLTTAASPAGGGTVTPASGWVSAGSGVTVSAAAASGYYFAGFTGALSGTATPQSLTMTGPLTVTAQFAANGTTPITVTSLPAGLVVSVDGTSYVTPAYFQWTVGSSHTLAAVVTPQTGADGLPYNFAYWSDGGEQTHTMTVAATTAPYVAVFTDPPGNSPVMFQDVPVTKTYYPHVNMLLTRFISVGCEANPLKYCPDAASGAAGVLTRGQAAVLIVRSIYSALYGNPEEFTLNSTTPYFNDVGASHLQFVYIQKLKELGLTNGCDGNGNYCPEGTLTYGQLAKLAVLARQVRDGKGLTLTCQGTNPDYDCNQIYPDVPSSDIFYAYIQRTYRLLNEQAAPPPADGCPYVYTPSPMRQFCENLTVPRGRFAIYLVSLVMNAPDPFQWPGGGGLPAVQSPRGSGANPINDTCSDQAAVEGALQHTNEFIWIGGSQFAWSRTTIKTGSGDGALPSPRLYTTYLYSQLVRQDPKPPIELEMTGGSGAGAELLTQVSDAVKLTSQHGVISGCLNGVAQPDMVASLTSTVTPPGQPVVTVITSSPVGFPLIVDGLSCTTTYTTVCSYTWSPGSQHTISAPSVQAGGTGTQYRFAGWSDGEAISHTVTAPSAPSNFTATFGTWYLLSLAVTPAGAGSIAASPSSGDGYYQSGAAVQVSATPVTGQQFLGFSGSLSGTANPQNLTMTRPHGVTGIFSSSSNYFITANPALQSVVAGGGLNYSIGVNLPSGSTIALSASGLPSGVGATFSPASLSGPETTTLSITVGANVPQGTYGVNVTATNGAVSRTAIVTLVVVAPGPANIITPASGSYLTGTVTFVWDAGAGVSQYSLSLGSTPNGSEYYSANLGTAQSATVAIPNNQMGTLYATLGSLISGAWQTRTASYLLTSPATQKPTGAERDAGGVASPPSDNYVYNNGEESLVWKYHLMSAYPPLETTSPPIDSQSLKVILDGQADPAVSAVLKRTGIANAYGSQNGFEVTYKATTRAQPGWRDLTFIWVCPKSTYGCYEGERVPITIHTAVYVYDATPIIDGVGYDPPNYPGGPFYIKIQGRFLGKGGTVSLCPTGAYPCDQAAGKLDAYIDINGPKTSWSPQTEWTFDPEKGTNYITALLTPPYGAAGDYDAQVTVSTGGTGFAYAGGPQQAQPGKSNQKGTVQVTPPPPPSIIITRDNGTANLAIDGTFSAVTVGQVMRLHAAVSNLVGGLSIQSQSWQVEGNTVANYLLSDQIGKVTAYTGSTSDSTTFYWVDGSGEQTKSVTCTAMLSNNAKITGTAHFRVSKPNIAFRIVPRNKIPIIDIQANRSLQFGSNDDTGMNYLAAGEVIGENGSLAITQVTNTTRIYTTGGGASEHSVRVHCQSWMARQLNSTA